MTRIIAVANQKGGVGKTTTSINLACGWARVVGPDKVLLVDIDPQANASAVLLGLEIASGPRRTDVPNIRDVLREDTPAGEAIYSVELAHTNPQKASTVDIIPSHLELATIEVELAVAFRGEHRLKKALDTVAHQYEVILIDCPPSLGILTLNALVCATEVIIPVDPGVFPLIGLGLLNSTMEQVKEVNHNLHLSGVIPTMTMNTVVSRETIQQLTTTYGNLVLPEVPRRVAIEESHVSGIDVFSLAPDSDGAKAYNQVLKELMKRG